MATSAWNKFNDFSEQLVRGVHDFDADVFKVVLVPDTDPPVAADVDLSTITQVANGGGYTTGGATTTITISETSGTTTVSGTEIVWTGSGAGFGPFRYAVLYNDTAANDPLIAWFDYGSPGITLVGAGETFTLKFNNASPGTMFTLV
jgi:hypothetical protein